MAAAKDGGRIYISNFVHSFGSMVLAVRRILILTKKTPVGEISPNFSLYYLPSIHKTDSNMKFESENLLVRFTFFSFYSVVAKQSFWF